ncbi:probable myosin-binding protein 4 isoform X2 [Populus nigra]|uniref:probable myosin-binding protein 4 isoform X2 n=1 Tax=Populus nigra TaxID=3691 RepID=UPI002B26B8EB|nr:probable myosin-binding protein 4 isoform X2 [Populus nigra]
MAPTGTSFVKVQRNLQRFMTVLQSAASEWFLIFLLLIDAALSYLLTKFASYCRLQIPCMFCSRLDHFLGNEKPGFYKNVICSNHRSEISTLISCHIHGKLADGYGMCEECLLSSTMKSKSSTDINRLLMGKFGFDIGADGFENYLWSRELVSGSVGTRMCSCCNKPWRSRQPSNRVAQLKSPRSGMTKPDIPMPRHLTHRENIKKRREDFPGSVTSHRLVRCGCNPGSQVAYTELKFTSDSESEFPFSDDDEGRSISHIMKELKEEPIVPPKTLTDGIASEKMTYHSLKGLASDVEFNRQQADHENYPSALPQLISFDDFPSSSSVMDIHVGVSSVRSELMFPFSQNYNLSALSDLMSLAVPSSSNAVEGPLEASERKSNDTGTGDRQDISINKHKEISILTAPTRGGGQVANEVPSINSRSADLIDVWKPAASGEDGESRTSMAKKQTVNGPERVDMELPTENVFAEGPDLSSHNAITGIEGHDDELPMNNDVRSNGVQMLKTESTGSSGLESLDGSFFTEIEGESIIDRLKRQVESDRRHISALYKELEEERSASAISANQAMAMITRLQEEKAALHMEALQYLRMMEEQAEYDVEALEKANDLLAEKEKEIQDLEAEIDSLQLNLSNESTAETIHVESDDLKGKNMSLENTSPCYDDTIVPCSSSFREVLNDNEKPASVKSSLSEYEEEKFLISKRLKGLERKLHQFASHGCSQSMSDSDYSQEAAHGGHNVGSLPAHEMSSASVGKHQVVANNESNHLIFDGKKSSKQHKEIDLVVLENEISDLNGRLEALEFDRNFLEHAFNSLQSGKEGLQFVQEIVHHLQELRKIGMRNSS